MKVRILGVPMDLGAERRGTDMGPSAIRAARLKSGLQRLGHPVSDGGNVFAHEPETRRVREERARYLGEIVRACDILAKRVEAAVVQDQFPLVLGGDHSIAVGSVGGAVRAGKKVAVLWVDAHGDYNTPETTPSGNVHGMPLATITGRGDPRLTAMGGRSPMVDEANVAVIGVRSLDPREREAMRASGIHVHTMREVDENGMLAVIEKAIQQITPGTDWLHLSLDMDAIDPQWAPGTGTPVPGGLTYREAHLAMEFIHDSGLLRSMEVVEVNPILDEKNRTAQLAVGLVQSALGKAIL